jgi:hypothetical protein
MGAAFLFNNQTETRNDVEGSIPSICARISGQQSSAE